MNNKTMPRRRNGFYYIANDKIYPSVTNILQVLAKPALVPWAAREAARIALADPSLTEQEAAASIYQTRNSAAARGKAIHSFAQMYQVGAKMEIDKLPQEFQQYAHAFVSWYTGIKPRILFRETEVHSNKYQYAGTLDMIFKDESGRVYLCDIKTGSDVYQEAELQLSAYKTAVEEMGIAKIDRQAVLLLGDNGTFKFCEVDAPFEVFIACHNIWTWQNKEKIATVNFFNNKKEEK